MSDERAGHGAVHRSSLIAHRLISALWLGSAFFLMLAASGVPHVLLRNGWYFENYTAQLDSYLATGTVLHAAGEGKIAAASRADLAAAAVTSRP